MGVRGEVVKIGSTSATARVEADGATEAAARGSVTEAGTVLISVALGLGASAMGVDTGRVPPSQLAP